jgi:hypothetical protein
MSRVVDSDDMLFTTSAGSRDTVGQGSAIDDEEQKGDDVNRKIIAPQSAILPVIR